MLAPIRGTNQYWFRVKGEVKAMIAEYGSPTLFLTLSCAEYDSADIAQYLRKRGVLGKVEQYYVKKEYQMRGAPHYHILLWIENAPVVGVNPPEEVCSFIQDRITCHIPDSVVSSAIIMASNNLQQRRGQGPYKKLTDVERAVIVAFATQHGIANASKEYKSASGNEEDSTVTSLPKGKQGRPFVLGEDMDHEVQDFIRAQRDIGAVVTRSTVICSGKGVVMR
uniref:Helitron helicase-like domain-containing protein n=1 Tax=Amphimedon queenslandica TaxID=400682 RepID=A0A1X7SYX6_AMPQE